MNSNRRRNLFLLGSIFLALLPLLRPANATTKGLSQIVTPDLQKTGELSLSFQAQSRSIGNPYELQGELGLNSWAEVAVFQGFSPGEVIFASEMGLIQNEPYLLSAGFLSLSTSGSRMQPFIEGGYYTEHDKWMAGGIYATQTEVLLGWAHDFDTHWRVQIDFQSGTENFSTLGFTYTLNDRFQFNPAVYFSNASFGDVSGYGVITYSLPVWKRPEENVHSAPKAL